MSQPCVLVVADPERIAELVATLSEPLPSGPIDVVISSGGDDTLDLFAARRPAVIVVTATLDAGDCKSLIDALRASVPRAEVAVVVIGDDRGPIRTALDAMDLEPDRFVHRPLSAKALRFAVEGTLAAVALVRRTNAPAAAAPRTSATAIGLTAEPERPPASPTHTPTLAGVAAPIVDESTASTRATLRARWESLADSIVDTNPEDSDRHASAASPSGEIEPPPLPPPLVIHPRRTASAPEPAPVQAWSPGTTAELDGEWPDTSAEPTPMREPTLILREDPSLRLDPNTHPTEPTGANRGAVRPRTEPPVLRADPRRTSEPAPRGPFNHRRTDPPATVAERGSSAPATARAATDRWPVASGVTPAQRPNASDAAVEIAPPSAPTTALGVSATPGRHGRERTIRETGDPPPVLSRTSTLDGLGEQAPEAIDSVIVAERSLNEDWSEPQALPEISDRESRRDIHPLSVDELGLDDFDDDLVVGDEPGGASGLSALGELAGAVNLARIAERTAAPIAKPERTLALDRTPELPAHTRPELPSRGPDDRIGGRDFARQLRAKMSQMAQRLFQGADDASPAASAAAHAPLHDHHTEIDLSTLGDEPVLGGGVTEIERQDARVEEPRPITSPGSWDTQVRERGVADAGELVRGATDAAMLLAKLFAQRSTGRASFKRDDCEKIVFFDQGRPVFASSNAPVDRMGELLVREGKITASQYERCQAHVAESGRRMGEILVDFGYLKRRELLPAVRRHVEDIIYSLFGWDHGTYRIALDATPSAERIRLSRHPASLILEGIRRKLDRTTLEKLVGSSATVIELGDRERLGGIINLGDLASEERAALAAFDGQADLAQVARTAGVDVADVLPFAWGLVVLGLATARRTETEVPDESGALVGETDLAIDRERVRARWQLVTDADYFALLGVRRDATAFEIRRAYQGARRDFAADCFPNDLRRELAQELEDIAHVLDEAFRVLRDDRLRLTYLHNLVE